MEKRMQTPMAQGRSTKIILMIKWIQTSRLPIRTFARQQMGARALRIISKVRARRSESLSILAWLFVYMRMRGDVCRYIYVCRAVHVCTAPCARGTCADCVVTPIILHGVVSLMTGVT